MPLPPYIAGRRARGRARRRPTTRPSMPREDGSVAAPTAGLHFTPELLAALDARGVSRHFVTLHVGAGTFLPVKTEDVARAPHARRVRARFRADDRRSAERGRAPRGGRIVAVGTTALRLLESAADEDGAIRPFARRDRDLHHARLPLPRRRRADDQLPPAALDAVHAGRAPSAGSTRCARPTPTPSRPATASIPTATPACSGAPRP